MYIYKLAKCLNTRAQLDHVMFFKELAFDRGSMKVVLTNTETGWSHNLCAIWYTYGGALVLVSKR